MPIVLIFDNVEPLSFPYPTTVAASVVSSFGPVFAKDVISNRSILIVDKLDNSPSTASTHVYSRATNGAVSEIARNNFTVDTSSTKAVYTVGCLRVDPVTSNRTIENVLECDHQ